MARRESKRSQIRLTSEKQVEWEMRSPRGQVFRRHPWTTLILVILSLYLIYTRVFSGRLTSSGDATTGSLGCGPGATHSWHGQYDDLVVPLDEDLRIMHEDLTVGAHAGEVTHAITVVLGRNTDETLRVVTRVKATKPLRQDAFKIDWIGGVLKLSTLAQPGSLAMRQKCIEIGVQVLMPVSAPMRYIGLIFPHADILIHESSYGSLPELVVRLGSGSVTSAGGSRLHIAKTVIKVDEGRVSGSLLLTNEMEVIVADGKVDLDIGWSPGSEGARVDMHVGKGDLSLKLQDHFYRGTTASLKVDSGKALISWPKSYIGEILLAADMGQLKIDAPAVTWQTRSKPGEMPERAEGWMGEGYSRHAVDMLVGKGDLTFAVTRD
ncbi:hypothetical protein PYCC9005_005413 [Savitreella phatthalungensis]